MFRLIMNRHRKDDAFFYLIRVKKVYNKDIMSIISNYRYNPYGEELEKKRQR